MDKHVEEALEWAKKEHKLQEFEFPAEEKAKLPELLKPVIDNYIAASKKAGVDGEAIVKEVKALKEKYDKAAK